MYIKSNWVVLTDLHIQSVAGELYTFILTDQLYKKARHHRMDYLLVEEIVHI